MSTPIILITEYREKRAAVSDLAKLSLGIQAYDADHGEASLHTLRYAQGVEQNLRVIVDWSGSLQRSGKPVEITLLRDGNLHWAHTITPEHVTLTGVSFHFTSTFPIGTYVLRASVERAKPAEYTFRVQAMPPGTVFVSDRPILNWSTDPIGVLLHEPGAPQEIYIGIEIDGPLPSSGKVIQLDLFHGEVPVSSARYRINSSNQRSYIPYSHDFAEGHYTARLSAPGEPVAEFSFFVRRPNGPGQDETTSPSSGSEPEDSMDSLGKPGTLPQEKVHAGRIMGREVRIYQTPDGNLIGMMPPGTKIVFSPVPVNCEQSSFGLFCWYKLAVIGQMAGYAHLKQINSPIPITQEELDDALSRMSSLQGQDHRSQYVYDGRLREAPFSQEHSPPELPARSARTSETDYVGDVFRVANGVSAPSLLYRVEPEYSEEARKAKHEGTIIISIVVDESGAPRNIRVVRALGYGLDQKAVEAVRQWQFRPGQKDGVAVAVAATVEVNFRLR